MDHLSRCFDRYCWRARIVPALLMLSPALLVFLAWFPEAGGLSLAGLSAGIWVSFAFLLSQIARRAGKSTETELWGSWGGAPTTRYLRHHNTEFNPVRKATCHRVLQALVPDTRLPSAQEEAEDPEAADVVYEACTRFLIRRTRDADRYGLVLKENVNYGFHRNWLGLRWFGGAIAVGGAAANAWRVMDGWENHRCIEPMSLLGVVLSITLLFGYLFWLGPRAVKVAADAYAERLLEACEDMDPESRQRENEERCQHD